MKKLDPLCFPVSISLSKVFLWGNIFSVFFSKKAVNTDKRARKAPFSSYLATKSTSVHFVCVVCAYFYEIHLWNLSRRHKGGLSRAVGVSLVWADSKLRRPSPSPPSLESPKNYPVRLALSFCHIRNLQLRQAAACCARLKHWMNHLLSRWTLDMPQPLENTLYTALL